MQLHPADVRALLFAMLAGLAALAAAACDPGFEEETEVIDLRPLAITASPPEQVLEIDPANLPSPAELLSQLQPIDICALAGDPLDRPLRWSFTVCVEGDDVRCDEGRPKIELAAAVTPDPETTLPRPRMCARLQPDLFLLAVLQSAIDADPLSGFSGIDLLLQWRVSADGAAEEFAGKRLRFAAKVPARRTANRNPGLHGFMAFIDNAGESVEEPLTLGRCVDQEAPLTIAPGGRVRLMPIEPLDLRERYVVPTFDGGEREFTETITYQWFTTSGSFSSASSGGKRDPFGNLPEIDSTYRTRNPRDVPEPIDVSIWIVQRDERLGEAWFESCVRVVP